MDKNFFNILKEIVEVNSFTENIEGIEKVQKILKKRFGYLPLKWEYFPESTGKYADTIHIKSQRKKGVSTILLSGHVDTAFERNFPYRENNTKVFGPGVSDMKAGVLMMFYLLERLYNLDMLYNVDIVLNSCEENGSVPNKKILLGIYNQGYDYGLVYEQTNEIHDEILDSTVIVSRKGKVWCRLNFTGNGGHAGTVTDSNLRQNTIDHLIAISKDLNQLTDFEKGTIVTIHYVEGGQDSTIIPMETNIEFEIRYNTKKEKDRIRKKLYKIFRKEYVKGVKTKVEWEYYYALYEENLVTKKFANRVINLGKRIGMNIGVERRGGWSDVCDMYSQGIVAMDGMGPYGGGCHSKKEWLEKASVAKMMKLSEKLIIQILNQDNG